MPATSPLDQADVLPGVLSEVVAIGRREKLPVEGWFSGTGLSPDDVMAADPLPVSMRQIGTVLRRAQRALSGRPLGMMLGTRDALVSFGVLGLALRSSATIGEALPLVELHRSAGSLLKITTAPCPPGLAAVFRELHPDPELLPVLVEEAICSVLVLVRSMLGRGWSPVRIDLGYPPPAHARQFEHFAGCPVHYHAAENRLIIDAADLVRPLPTHHESTRSVATDAARRLLVGQDERSSVVAAVERMIAVDLRHVLNMQEAADRLHITERTLHRRLAESGVRYRELRDRVRERHATMLLQESELGVDEIGRRIGFSDGREFRRAYRRWTGGPPSRARHPRAAL